MSSLSGFALARKDLRRKCRQSLFFFCKYILDFPDVNERTHGGMIKALESSSDRKLIVMPRGTLKSTIACVAYPIWRLIKDPNERILIDSELYTNSKNFIREIKQHLTRPELEMLFGKFLGPVWNEGEIIIDQRSKVLKEASIVAGSAGTTKVGQHFTCIIGDDYNSPANSNTPENAEKVIQHYRYNTSILEPNGTYIIIGTRYSELDLIGHILTNEIEYDKVSDNGDQGLDIFEPSRSSNDGANGERNISTSSEDRKWASH